MILSTDYCLGFTNGFHNNPLLSGASVEEQAGWLAGQDAMLKATRAIALLQETLDKFDNT